MFLYKIIARFARKREVFRFRALPENEIHSLFLRARRAIAEILNYFMFISTKNIKKGFHKHPLSKVWVLGLVLSLFSACNVEQFLQKDQHIVRRNTIELKNIHNKRVQTALKTELTTLYKQRDLPDFFVGRKNKNSTWYWFKSQQADSTTPRLVRWQYSNFSRPPSFYDEKATVATVKNIRQYLQNNGYLYPSVTSEKNFHGKEKGMADVSYLVDPGRLYVIDTTEFVCADTAIQNLINDLSDETLLRRGVPLNAQIYEQERQRLTQSLNNLGYARFTSNYIAPLDADTTTLKFDLKGNRLVSIKLSVQRPNDALAFNKFSTGEVIVYPKYDVTRGETIAFDSIIAGKIFFTYSKGDIGLRAVPLSKAIPLMPNEPYRKDDADRILRQLTNLSIYRFVNIKPMIEECNSNFVNYKIYLTPNKKMSFEGGVEINYANISNAQSGKLGRIGLATDIGFTHRNVFGGAERFNSTLSLGLDYGLGQINRAFSQDIRFQNVLSTPKFLNLTRSWQVFNRLHLVNRTFYNDLSDNASSEITLGYAYRNLLQLNLYKLQQFNLNFRNVLKRKDGLERYTLNQSGIELQLSQTDEGLNANQRFLRSLQKQLLTGLAFRSLTYENNGTTNSFGERFQYTFSLEQSGSELWAAEQVFNSGAPIKVAVDDLTFSKFWRTEFDIRYTRQLFEKRAFAARFSVGLARAFGGTFVPYSRQFSVGGPNSIRGWLAQDIGQGGYKDLTNKSPIPFQAGDVKMELNSEYRFPIFWRVESAIFLDAGNIWNLKADPKIPNGNIDKFWFDQIAISSGVGLRLDVTYAVLRLDFGFRLRNPYKDDLNNNWISLDNYFSNNNVNPNFALGFPF
ncbi:MAG: BamA/TamA family outer membrane protein [Saprospiraceae bacterium]|nr:BamA/TamA family outer membrane protein [Saprospiraceae bacterium]